MLNKYNLVLDIETSTQWSAEGRTDSSPYNPDNFIVSIGYNLFKGEFYDEGYIFYDDPNFKDVIQDLLDSANLFIAHNAKFDLNWLYECGFLYSGKVWDTMIGEYLLARGQKWQLSLDASCKRRGVSEKKKDIIQEYWNKKISFDKMPRNEVQLYGEQDVKSCKELYEVQVELYDRPRNKGLIPTLEMSNEFLLMLSEVERNGIYINSNALNAVERDYLAEKEQLLRDINSVVVSLVGDTPYNLASPQQLSEIIYSRKILDKDLWKKEFNIGIDEKGKPFRRPWLKPKELIEKIHANTVTLFRTVANQCTTCGGTGRIHKLTKSGQIYKNLPKCQDCGGSGIIYTSTGKIAGLALGPRSIRDLTSNGFSTDKEMLEYLAALPKTPEIGKRLLKGLIRLNAVETYLSSFVGGIRRATRANNILHFNLNQCITATGRLSSSDPNFQNQPRGLTFPVKRCMRSRFVGGHIAEIDFSQLEFRVAAELAHCPVMEKEIKDGVDVHKFTAATLTDAGQPTTRQEAKPKTFRPLYGGKSGTPAEVLYNRAFMDKYTGLASWHTELLTSACFTHYITLPSGREFHFPNAKKQYSGYVDGETQIKNFPVQATATADIVPIACILLWKYFKEHNVKSLIINTVHDSIICDIYPGEENLVLDLMVKACMSVKEEFLRRYGYVITIPLGVEVKMGKTWLSMITVREYDEVKELKHV